VGMKSTSCSREMLAWVIAKLAQPGDHILAVHVAGFAACRTAARAAAEEGEKSTTTHIQQQLGKSLEGVLSVYEDMCNLKRVSLQSSPSPPDCGPAVSSILNPPHSKMFLSEQFSLVTSSCH
jgi:hypothetical protein